MSELAKQQETTQSTIQTTQLTINTQIEDIKNARPFKKLLTKNRSFIIALIDEYLLDKNQAVGILYDSNIFTNTEIEKYDIHENNIRKANGDKIIIINSIIKIINELLLQQ